MIAPPRTPVALLRSSLRDVLPGCTEALARWTADAESIPDPELRRQALASITSKRFHADAGNVYATAVAPGPARDGVIRLIVAFQTISDYLDNLCDRSTSLDPEDFAALHESMIDAVSATPPRGDYYRHRAERDDGGYLDALVSACRDEVGRLPGFAVARPVVETYVGLYCDLQVHKHVDPAERVDRLTAWFADRWSGEGLLWQEFAAATGSTLLVFALFGAATDPGLDAARVTALESAYFPWICGLHILLDYFIDQDEDVAGGDLNFVAQYSSAPEARERIQHVAARACAATRPLQDAGFHRFVVDGLVGMYLSDAKAVAEPRRRAFAARLTWRTGRNAVLFHLASRYYRAKVARAGS